MDIHRLYQHEPIFVQHFRILRLLPGGPHDAIRIQLFQVPLQNSGSYEAVSYCWDDQQFDRWIECDGRPLKVTPNCVSILRRFRTNVPRNLWIDAICIDQNSPRDKQLQLPLMGDIYRNAHRVLVWLGEGSARIDRAFWYLNRLAQLPGIDVRNFGFGTLQTLFRVATAQLLGTPTTLSNQVQEGVIAIRTELQEENRNTYGREGYADCNIIGEIFKHKWFTRAWTLQELVVARIARFICGQSEITYGHLSSSAGLLLMTENNLTDGNGENESVLTRPLNVYRILRRQIHTFGNFTRQDRSKALLRTIAGTRHLQATKPHDKVYSILGILTTLGIRNLPIVDYEKPVAEIYLDLMNCFVENDEDPRWILGGLGGKREVEGLASWIPDLSTTDDLVPISSGAGPEDFSATRSPRTSAMIINTELHVAGKIIDRISHRPSIHIGEVPPDDAHPRIVLRGLSERTRVFQQWCIFAYGHLRQSHVYAGQDLDDVLCRTLLQNGLVGFGSGQVPQATMQQFPAWVKLLFVFEPLGDASILPDARRAVEYAMNDPSVHALYFRTYDAAALYRGNVAWQTLMAIKFCGAGDVHGKIVHATRSRTVFYTDGGRIGTGSDSIEIGDCIALLDGVNVPMVIRMGEHGGYKMIAPAYVHGIMYGEQCPEDLTEFVFI